MSSLFKKIKSISQWEKDLVIGYTKEAQKLVRPNQIPMAISYLCLVYYYQYDYFDKCDDDALEINQQKDTVTVVQEIEGIGTVYGNMYIMETKPPIIYSWTFETSATPVGMEMVPMVGISDSTEPIHWSDYGENVDWFVFYGKSNQIDSQSNGEHATTFKDYGTFKNGDNIKMEINTKKQTVRYYINEKDQGIAFENIDFRTKKFKFIVMIHRKDYKVKLIDFSKTLCQE